MGNYALTGSDTLLINSKLITDLTDGSVVSINYDNDRVGLSTGKDDNTVFADNRQGGNATVELRVLAGSSTDRYLNGLSVAQDNDFVSSTLLTGVFSKRVGDGQGNVSFINYNLSGGVFLSYPNPVENNTGDTEQGTMVYRLKFAKVTRSIA